MDRRSVSQYMGPLDAASGSPIPKPGWPVVTPPMVDEVMRVTRQRHPRSPQAMADPAVRSVARGLSQQFRESPVPSPPKPQRMVGSPAPQPEEMDVVNPDKPRVATTWLLLCQAPTNAGSQAGPLVAESGDELNDLMKEDDASLPASGLQSETLKPGLSHVEETVESNGSAEHWSRALEREWWRQAGTWQQAKRSQRSCW